MDAYELIIVGGGAAGFAAAMKANELKVNTLMINNRTIGLGGTCVNVGCVPTKFLLYMGDRLHSLGNLNFEGIQSTVSFEFSKIIEAKDLLVSSLQMEKYQKVLKELAYVHFQEGNARLLSSSEIQLDTHEVYQANKIIIATGSSPFIPPIKGIETIDYLTNVTALQLEELPTSMLIIGGGTLGVEFAQLFSRFGVQVTILELVDTIVPNEEPEISTFLQKYLQEEGIEIYTKIKGIELQKEGNVIVITAIHNGKEKKFKTEQLLIATGRVPNTRNLNLEAAGVKLGRKGEIQVDEYMRASNNIWAAGDVTGEPMLETIAAREGMIAATNAVSPHKMKMSYRVVPHAVFTDPQIGSVGLTDAQANEQGYTCNCRTVPIELVPKASILKDKRGVIKMVINKETEEILGVHILAPDAANLIHEAIMIIVNNMKLNDVINTIHIFPTLSEAIKLAAQSFKRDITKMSCCIE
ncbi:MAG: mercury(II) reductase [Candidatus Helarchaeota archaeon]